LLVPPSCPEVAVCRQPIALEAWLPQPQAASAKARTATVDGAANGPSAGRAGPAPGRAPGALRIVHRPYEQAAAAPTTERATRSPDPPTPSGASPPVLAGSNAAWMTAFQAACSATAGQTLPVSSRRRAYTKLTAVCVTMKSKAARAGGGPTR